MKTTFPAEITNLECSNLSAEQKNDLKQLLEKHKLLVIRGQNLTKNQQVEFTSIFGMPDSPWNKEDPEEPRIQLVNNVNDNHVYAWQQQKNSIVRIWHVDNSFMRDPVRYTMLHIKAVPPTGGDTKFINTQLAYDDLDPATKKFIDEKQACHTFRFIAEKWKDRKDLSTQNYPDVSHPLVLRDNNGCKSLYFSKLGISHVQDMNKEDSDRLLTVLYEHCKNDKYKYRHKWQAGDILIWDNAATMHKATFCDPKYLRAMNRTNIRFEQDLQVTTRPRLKASL